MDCGYAIDVLAKVIRVIYVLHVYFVTHVNSNARIKKTSRPYLLSCICTWCAACNVSV